MTKHPNHPKNTDRQRITVVATGLNSAGEAVFRHEGQVGFVAGLLPGESGEVWVAARSKSVLQGSLFRRLSTAPERVPHPCPHAEECPASRFGCLDREAELEAKRIQAVETMRRIGGMNVELELPATAGPEWGYRNKLELSSGVTSRRKPAIGYHPPHDPHSVIPVQDCLLADEGIRQLLAEALPVLNKPPHVLQTKIARLILRSGDGLHLHLILKEALTPDERDILSAFHKSYSGLVGITTSHLNRPQDKTASDTTRTIAGDLLLTGSDGVATHPLTFRQVNEAASKLLLQEIDQWGAELNGPVFDLYGGYGPFARRLAKNGTECFVLERSITATEDGIRANKHDQFPIRYYGCDVPSRFHSILPDVRPAGIVLDPSHEGAGAQVITEILKRSPKSIAYIACHGAALARDLKLLTAGGYQLRSLKLFDLFPKTPDLEWIAILDR